MVDEAELRSSVRSAFKALVVQRVVGCCGEWGPFSWPMLPADVAVFGASHGFAELRCNGWFHHDSESCNGSDRQQTTKQ